MPISAVEFYTADEVKEYFHLSSVEWQQWKDLGLKTTVREDGELVYGLSLLKFFVHHAPKSN